MANDSHYRRTRLPKESRTIPQEGNRFRGNRLDFGIIFRCWHCGFLCRKDRETLEGSRGTAGDDHEDYNLASDPSINNTLVVDGTQVIMELGADGNPKEIMHNFKSVISKGCPQCGCTNWLGKY